MPGVQGYGDGRAHVHVAKAQHEVARAGHDRLHRRLVVAPVDAADELDVVRAPWCVRVDGGLVASNGKHGIGVPPGKRQAHGACLNSHALRRRRRRLDVSERRQQRRQADPVGIELHVQGANAGRQIAYAGKSLLGEQALEAVNEHTGA